MSKITYEQKIELLERYQKRPMSVQDPEIISAIKVDVIKGASKGVKRANEPGRMKEETELYNECMGAYRQFLKDNNSHLDIAGRKAKAYSEAMYNIIDYVRGFAKSNGRPHDNKAVLTGIKFIFNNWERLNSFHRNRLALPDIYNKIDEIIPMIRNGYDKKTASKAELDSLEQSIKNRRQ